MTRPLRERRPALPALHPHCDVGVMTEEQPYEVVAEYPTSSFGGTPDHVVAETRVKGSFEGAGSKAFMRLLGYLSGRNRQS